MKFRNLPIKTKMMSGFFLITALVVVFGINANRSSQQLTDTFESFYQGPFLLTRTLAEFEVALNILDSQTKSVNLGVIYKNMAQRDLANQRVVQYQKNISQLINRINSFYQTDVPDVLELTRVAKSYSQAVDDYIELRMAQRNGSKIYLQQIIPSYDKLQTIIERLHKKEELNATNYYSKSKEQANQAIQFSYFVMVVCISLALLLGYFLSALITTPISAVTRLSDSLAKGQLDQRCSLDQQDEAGKLASSLNKSMVQLADTMGNVQKSSSVISLSSESLSVMTEQLNTASKCQSDELEQIATAIAQMSSSIDDVARNINESGKLGHQVDEKNRQAQLSVEQTLVAIDQLVAEVNKSSQRVKELKTESSQIESVVGVIQSIAEQTNLLALNAAIEAARAGEQGRGFAVVADEVRNLAQRTQTSTKDIQEMVSRLHQGTDRVVQEISQSSLKASETTATANKTKQAIFEIGEAIEITNDFNSQIASACEEQAVVAAEINNNIQLLHTQIQNTHQAAKIAATTSKELKTQGLNLEQEISFFKF